VLLIKQFKAGYPRTWSCEDLQCVEVKLKNITEVHLKNLQNHRTCPENAVVLLKTRYNLADFLIGFKQALQRLNPS